MEMLEERSWLVDCREETQEERADAMETTELNTNRNDLFVSVVSQCSSVFRLILYRWLRACGAGSGNSVF